MDGGDYSLTLTRNGTNFEYSLLEVEGASGEASIVEVTPDVFSILLNRRSFTVQLVPNGSQLEVWTSGKLHRVTVTDARDRSSKSKKVAAAGPIEIRAQMPGKIIKLLVQPGSPVQAGQGVIIVEAMKMQNEMKSPKDGVVSKIQAAEGQTVLAGETLLVVE